MKADTDTRAGLWVLRPSREVTPEQAKAARKRFRKALRRGIVVASPGWRVEWVSASVTTLNEEESD